MVLNWCWIVINDEFLPQIVDLFRQIKYSAGFNLIWLTVIGLLALIETIQNLKKYNNVSHKVLFEAL